MPVELDAVAVYVTVEAPWQRAEEVPKTKTGVPTVGVIFTVRTVCADGPLHPFAVTRISTEPEKPFAHVITPVDALIEPAAALLNDQLKPVLFVAVVAYVVVVVPFVNWQVGSLPAEIVIAVGTPTVGVMFTVRTVW